MNNLRHLAFVLLLFILTPGIAQEQYDQGLGLEQMTLGEVNFLRTRPAEYAETRLKEYFDEKADNGAYRFLQRMKPVHPLVLNDTLNILATNYAKLISFKKKLSHNLRGTPKDRADKAGYYGMIGENLAAGSEDKYNALVNSKIAAVEFVRMLVIDMGIKDYGHRKILVEPGFRDLGIGFNHVPNDQLKNYFVMEFGRQQ